MVSGRLLVNGNDFYVGNSTSNLSQLALKTDIPSVAQYVHPAEKQCNYSYTHPSTKQCNYSYTHPSEKQCSWNPPGGWTLLRDQTYSRSSLAFTNEYAVSGAVNLTGCCAIACRISGTYQIINASSYTARINVEGIDKAFLYANYSETGKFNIDVTNACFFETAFCATDSFSGLSLDPFINSGRVQGTYPVSSSYGGITITTGNIQWQMTVTYNLRQQIWGLKIS